MVAKKKKNDSPKNLEEDTLYLDPFKDNHLDPLDPSAKRDAKIIEWEKKQRFVALQSFHQDIGYLQTILRGYRDPVDLSELQDDEAKPVEDEEPMSQHRRSCYFCELRSHDPYTLDAMNPGLLMKFMTSLGKIMPRRYTGCCAVHQRRVSRTIKHAINLGTFSFRNGEFSVISPYFEKKADDEDKSRDDDEEDDEEGRYEDDDEDEMGYDENVVSEDEYPRSQFEYEDDDDIELPRDATDV